MSSPYYQYGLELSGGRPHFFVGTSTGVVGAAMDTALALNQWTHLAVVFNGLTTQFYVNGTMVSSKSLAASITARGMALRMGADADTRQFYKGVARQRTDLQPRAQRDRGHDRHELGALVVVPRQVVHPGLFGGWGV